MSSKWPQDIKFKEVILTVSEKSCRYCGSNLAIHSHREHRIYTLEGAKKLVCKQAHCSNKKCKHYSMLINPESELTLTMPRWKIGWDLFTWIGFRRFKRHWSVPQIKEELLDSYQIILSEDAIANYLHKYQIMVAAWHQDLKRWREDYKACSDVILSIDGIQPEKGHETLYVVRELRKKRIWFAESVISSSNAEIQKLIKQAKQLAQKLDKPVKGWVSDKQDAFVTAIAAEFPNIPHRYCNNHFLRDLAEPIIEKDSHMKVQMRKKVRGLRAIEKETLAKLDKDTFGNEKLTSEQREYAARIVLDYCAAIRGIVNDNHGGPLNPAGLRMSNALEEVCKSIERNLKKTDTPISSQLRRLNSCIKRGLSIYAQDKTEIVGYVKQIDKVFKTLDPKNGTLKKRLCRFRRLKIQLANDNDSVKTHMSKIMLSFEPGLFVGSDDLELPADNLDLERWFKKPKGHERKIHGRRHSGVRIVHEGPTLLPVLDAHLELTKPLTYQDLLPYALAKPPESQIRSVERQQVMTKASSKKKEKNY